jgi:hypothetical protein
MNIKASWQGITLIMLSVCIVAMMLMAVWAVGNYSLF